MTSLIAKFVQPSSLREFPLPYVSPWARGCLPDRRPAYRALSSRMLAYVTYAFFLPLEVTLDVVSSSVAGLRRYVLGQDTKTQQVRTVNRQSSAAHAPRQAGNRTETMSIRDVQGSVAGR